jgi:predicted CxxxxCH...CXXCH cytochrome family protein
MLTGGNSAKVVLFETIVQSPAVKSKNDSTASFNPASRTCSGVYCHEKVGATPAWNSGAALPCNACHGSSADPGGAPTGDSHVLHGYSCTTCHAATTANGTTIANTALHVNGRPDVAQGPGATFTYASGGTCSNISCHFGASATWGTKQSGHLATLGTGEVLVFAQANTDHGANFTIPENCASCHSPSLVAQHAGKCEICHAGTNPASGLIGSWSKGCSAGACHSTIHDGGLGADHFMMWQNSSAACDRCHDGVGGFPGSGDNCSRCHNPGLTAAAVGDHQPPTTTSDAASTYVGAGTIHLAATDAGTSGVSVTWFSLDGHEWTLGTDVVFGAPTTGSRPHTLQFYSVDHALNAEVVKTVAFTVQALADGTPPSTTSSFNPANGAVFTASQPVVLTASDNASGVKATYYRIDAGAFIQGASFTVTDGLHTFSYYSVDNANNTETTHVSNSFRVDTIAPATTSTAVNGSAYTGPQTFTLSASDAGSGVASTWYKLDGAVFTQGTSISVPAPASGSASHTLSWYSLDVAGNQEVTRSVTFTVQLPVADSTAPTTTSSFNPAAGAVFNANRQVTLLATDNAGGSGVRATYYRIDGGAYVQSTSFTVTEGVHTFSYYSVDNANNTETAHVSNSFRVDMIAPVTTSTATNGMAYTGPQTFTLAATDTNGSGVASTWYTLDGGALTSGTVISIAAPASGSASHTITWYSVDLAGNQEATRSVTFAIAAPVTGGTTHISFRTSCDVYGNGWYGVTWQIRNAVGTVIEEFWNDDCGHPSSAMWADYDVPSGAAYELYGEFWDMDVDAAVDSATRAVSPAEASPDATIEWWFH